MTARRADACDVVDVSIAVVIDHVARFRGWQDGALTNLHACLALRHAKLTRSDVGHRTAIHACIAGVVVDHAIAVVVDAVA